MIQAATTVPAKKSLRFLFASGEQTHVELRILQGKGEKADENLLLSSIVFELGDDVPEKPEVEITFDIDANYEIHIKATLVNSGRSRRVSLKRPIFESLPESAVGGTLRLE